GRYADIVLAADLKDFSADVVIANGELLAEGGKLLVEPPSFSYPPEVMQSVRIARPLTADDFHISTDANAREIQAHVIGVIENQAPTRHLTLNLPVSKGEVLPDPAQDVARIALVERHRATGEVVNGFVQGFRLNVSCAIASSVAHDSHHLLVV